MSDKTIPQISNIDPKSILTTESAMKASKFTTSIDDVTDNDAVSPINGIVMKYGYPKTQIELDGLKLIGDQVRREKRLSVIKFIFGALIASIPSVLLFFMGRL